MNTSRRRLLAALALPLAACGTPRVPVTAPAAVGPPRVRVGERWRYGLTNRYNGLAVGMLTATVLEAQPALRVGLAWTDGRSPAEEICTAPWQIVQDPHWDLPLLFAQPQPLLPPDLAYPAAVTTQTTFTTPGDSGRFWWQQTVVPGGWERLAVPAGTFDCLRVDRRILFQHPDLLRLRSERRDTVWYAPAVGRWVQRESTGLFWRSSLRYGGMREDWVLAQLLDHTGAPQS